MLKITLNKNSFQHNTLAKELKKCMGNYKKKFNKSINKKVSVIFGSATGVCIQALEENIKVYHIPNLEILDVFSEKIWPNIKVKKISNNVFVYKIKKKNCTFFLNNEKNKFKKYVDRFLI